MPGTSFAPSTPMMEAAPSYFAVNEFQQQQYVTTQQPPSFDPHQHAFHQQVLQADANGAVPPNYPGSRDGTYVFQMRHGVFLLQASGLSRPSRQLCKCTMPVATSSRKRLCRASSTTRRPRPWPAARSTFRRGRLRPTTTSRLLLSGRPNWRPAPAAGTSPRPCPPPRRSCTMAVDRRSPQLKVKS